MNFFPLLHLFAAMIFFLLAFYIYAKSPKSLINRICAIYFFFLGVWSFCLVFIHNGAVSKETARIFTDISVMGWIGFSSFFLWFILAFTGRDKLLGKVWFYLPLVGIPLFFIYLQWTHRFFPDLISTRFGWKPIYGPSPWPQLFILYFIGFMAAGLYLNYTFMRTTRHPALKNQARIFMIGVFSTLILGITTDVILPLLHIHAIPNIADFLALILAFSVVYAIVKYRFLALPPVTAASNIISTMFDSVILLNLKGEIVEVNRATGELLGFSEEEMKGRMIEDILSSDDDLENGEMRRILLEENPKNLDLTMQTRQGERIPVLFSSSLLKDEAGDIGAIVCVARDISERKKLEEELLKSRQLESIGSLAGGIAHDFNNLLSVIMGNITLVLRDTPPGTKDYRLLVNCQDASLRAAQLANKFITFSSGGWLNRKKLNFSELVENILDPELPMRKISIRIDIPAKLEPINGDAEQIYQVLQNILLNAREAMPDGGEITIKAENTTVNPRNQLGLKKGTYVKINISDTGAGIPAEDIDRVFEPYFSTKSTYHQKGMGLGLTICYSIIKKHDGHITVASEPGKGTAVTFYLPAFMAGNPAPLSEPPLLG